jgi:hypothetical protein
LAQIQPRLLPLLAFILEVRGKSVLIGADGYEKDW